MRPEKQNLTKEYLARLNASPFFIVVNYKGLKVSQLTELRKRLHKAGAEIHVVKNSVFRVAAKEAGVGDLNGALGGQLAVVTGQRDISTAAKVVKTFRLGTGPPEGAFWLSEQPAARTAGDHDTGGPSFDGGFARQTPRFVHCPGLHAGQAVEHTRQPDGSRAASPRRETARSSGAGGELDLNEFHLRSKPTGKKINKQQRKSSVCRQRT
jgi:hypothetical protein